MQSNCESDLFVGSSLIDMYAKLWEYRGCKESVQQDDHTQYYLLECHACRVYAIHGHATEALGHFEQMCQEGLGLDNGHFCFTSVSLQPCWPS